MTAEVLYFVNGNDTYESGGDFRKAHLEKGELILDEETDMVHSPLYKQELFKPVGSLRTLITLITLMQEPERRFPGSHFLNQWGEIFRTESDVSRTFWFLRLNLADVGIYNNPSASKYRRRTYSLIHSGLEGYSLTPYITDGSEQEDIPDNTNEIEQKNRLDAGIYTPSVTHLRKDGIYFSSARYDFTSPLKKK